MEQNKIDFDVIVCGAGPSGAVASLFLSQQGVRHLIIDQSVFPRAKVCGDGITPLCSTILQQVIPEVNNHFEEKGKVKRIKNIRIYGFNKNYADLKTADFVSEEKNLLYTISRFIFDDYLVQHVKQKQEATLWENTKLTGYSIGEDGVLLQVIKDGLPVEVSAKLIIAADGDRSIFRKRIFKTAIDRDQMVAAVRTYFKNVIPSGNNDLLEVYVFKEVMPGYFWIFPMADGTHNVGLGITSDVIQASKINLRKLLDELICNHPLLKERFKYAQKIHSIEGSGLPIMMEKAPKLSDTRILLTGDAGSLADPISGEGIGPGIVSGKYAALVAADAVKVSDFSAEFLQKYDFIMHDKITSAYENRIHLFDWFAKYPYRINWLIWALPKVGWIRNILANLTFGQMGFQDRKSFTSLKKLFKRNE